MKGLLTINRWPMRRFVWSLMGCVVGVVMAISSGETHHETQHREQNDIAMSVPEMLDLYECGRCHRLATPHRLIGPSLWKLGDRMDAITIRASILKPNAVIPTGYPAGLMQKRLQTIGFYSDITRAPAILDRIVAYLAGERKQISKAIEVVHEPVQSAEALLAIADGAVLWPDGQQFEVMAFHIDARLVTKAEFAVFIANGGYTTKRYWDRTGWSVFTRRRNRTQPMGWQLERDMLSEQPVVGLSWYEADAYCRWAGKVLPSVLEWELACQEVQTWLSQPPRARSTWEWTAEAIWKGGADPSYDRQTRCTTRLPSYRALDGKQTGFRCRGLSTREALPQPAEK